jgi:V/A-type H+-transporting ATPase subunit E
MGTDVATFARQLKEDGIAAARTEAAKILADARKEAEKIISQAKAEAGRMEKEAQTRIQSERHRSEDEMKLVARDLVNSFRKRIEEAGTRLLKAKVSDSLNDKEVIRNAIAELLKNQKTGQEWEVSLGTVIAKPLADTVVALFKEKGAVAKLGEELAKAGFEMKTTGGSEVFEVTEVSVTDSFRKLLSPELKKFLEA